MKYPSKLLPRIFFRIINFNKLDDTVYLIRHTPIKQVWDPATSLIQEKYIAEPRAQMEDLSLNIYGKFKERDISIEIDRPHKERFFAQWKPLQFGKRPKAGQFLYDDSRGWFFVPLSALHNKIVPNSTPLYSDFSLTCEVVHKPVKCNFWHVQLQWRNERGELLTQAHTNWKRSVQTTTRSMIKMFAKPQILDHKTIPLSQYLIFNFV